MYTEQFKDLVKKAVQGSRSYYKDVKFNKPNPFYIGFGNPNSKILIVGQEKAIKIVEDLTLFSDSTLNSESIQNPYQWEKIVNEGITDLEYVFENKVWFINPLHPYNEKPKNGNTWNHYQTLIEMTYPELKHEKINNSFFLKSFITEVNHEVSKSKLGNQRDLVREGFTNHKFFRQFPVTILAAGDYLTDEEIENRYDVRFLTDESERARKFRLFRNDAEKRIVINTRQMSNFFFNRQQKEDYFLKIVNMVKEYTRSFVG
jgi:hypothetical protein